MAGFKTHITFSTMVGVGYGAGAYWHYQFPVSTCVLAAGLCSVSGMLPDIDSESGRPVRESMSFGAAVVPMMMVNRFKMLGLDLEWMILAGGAIYLAIRFGLAALLKRFTVHRGMFHSIPACAIAGLVTFLAFDHERMELRYFVAGAVMTGFMSHLILDEIWSVNMGRGGVRLKSSFGTALKFWGDCTGPNLLTYALVIGLSFFAVNDEAWMNQISTWADSHRDLTNHVLQKLGLDQDQLPPTASLKGPEQR